MNYDDNITIRDLSGEEISFLLRYRSMTDEDKQRAREIIEQFAADHTNLNTD